MTQTDEKPGDSLTRCFNAMSWARRGELQAAALFKTLSADMRADVHENPWKFAGYAVYMSAMAAATISPVPALALGMAFLLWGWAKMGLTPGARTLDNRLRDAFNPVSLMTEYAPFLTYSTRSPHVGVRSWPLLIHTLGHNFRDVYHMTRDALAP